MLNGSTNQPDILMIMTIFTITYLVHIWVSELVSKVDYYSKQLDIQRSICIGPNKYPDKITLLLGRKRMTKLDSILKSRDITLPTKVCIVKAMVFPVVMYGCDSWIIKKTEC